jgi:hypothetical protein
MFESAPHPNGLGRGAERPRVTHCRRHSWVCILTIQFSAKGLNAESRWRLCSSLPDGTQKDRDGVV